MNRVYKTPSLWTFWWWWGDRERGRGKEGGKERERARKKTHQKQGGKKPNIIRKEHMLLSRVLSAREKNKAEKEMVDILLLIYK